MKKIALNTDLFILIDDEDFDKVKDYKWAASRSSKKVYARTFAEDINGGLKRKSLFIQHLIVGKAPQGQRLFFKDGNALNCQKSNLSFVSRSAASHSYYKKIKNNKKYPNHQVHLEKPIVISELCKKNI